MQTASNNLSLGAFAGAGDAARSGFARAWNVIGLFFERMINRHAKARVTSVLSGMTDEQLAEIGITRSQIPHYVSDMMPGE